MRYPGLMGFSDNSWSTTRRKWDVVSAKKQYDLSFHLSPIKSGTRIVVNGDKHELLRFDIFSKVAPNTITIYWQGTTTAKPMFRFFEENTPHGKTEESFKAVAYMLNRRVCTGSLKTVNGLRLGIPSEACFLRLEHNSSANMDDPDFTVWSPVGTHSDRHTEPKYIGVCAKPGWLNRIPVPLSEFISSTHRLPVRSDTALDSVRQGLQNIPTP